MGIITLADIVVSGDMDKLAGFHTDQGGINPLVFSPHVLGVLLALTSALVWGSGDFWGGLASRRTNQFQVVALAALSGLVALTAFAFIKGEAVPSAADFLWAALAGISGTIGIAALYRALAVGNAANVAPTTAVLGTGMPVVYGIAFQGVPSPVQLVGLITAMLGIWLVTQSEAVMVEGSDDSLGLAFLAGVGFGGFFILIAQVETSAILTPLIIAKSASLLIALLFLLTLRSSLPAVNSTPMALLAGVLDAGGNAFYLLAKQFIRLDIATVLASMYPVCTVILARAWLKQEVSRRQWAGVLVCMIAVALMAS